MGHHHCWIEQSILDSGPEPGAIGLDLPARLLTPRGSRPKGPVAYSLGKTISFLQSVGVASRQDNPHCIDTCTCGLLAKGSQPGTIQQTPLRASDTANMYTN